MFGGVTGVNEKTSHCVAFFGDSGGDDCINAIHGFVDNLS
jgi:hypothetical protein